jgi:nucleoside-diphosphate-sugar epimerase
MAAALEVAQRASGTEGEALPCEWTAMESDMTRPMAGMGAEDVARVRAAGVEVFWHFASDLRFEERNVEATRRVNVEGSLEALEAAVAMGCGRFVYVSTAYVCGRAGGVIEERLVEAERCFSNGYEASKAEAERLLVAEGARLGMALTIVRPSIVIGPRGTRSAYGSDTGLYNLVHAAMWIRGSQAGQAANLRVPACPGAEINFIPVDCVVADMLGLARDGFGAGRGDETGQIYHLTSSASVTVAECWRAMAEEIGMRNVTLVAPGEMELNSAERLIARRIGFFLDYITVDRRFARTLQRAWTLDAAEFAGYVRKAKERVETGAAMSRGHAG